VSLLHSIALFYYTANVFGHKLVLHVVEAILQMFKELAEVLASNLQLQYCKYIL
jgi:hypothetical protein